jgi:hypothetical protein
VFSKIDEQVNQNCDSESEFEDDGKELSISSILKVGSTD